MTTLESIMAAPSWFWLIFLAAAIAGGLCLWGFFFALNELVSRQFDKDHWHW